MSGARNGLPPGKRDSFDAGYAASAKEVGYEVRSRDDDDAECEWRGGGKDAWWLIGPDGLQFVPSVPERAW